MRIIKHLRSDWFRYGFETIAVIVGILFTDVLGFHYKLLSQKMNQYEEALTSTKDLIRVLNKEKLQL